MLTIDRLASARQVLEPREVNEVDFCLTIAERADHVRDAGSETARRMKYLDQEMSSKHMPSSRTTVRLEQVHHEAGRLGCGRLDASIESMLAKSPDMTHCNSVPEINLIIETDLSCVEQEWRAFEKHADCTVFQTFDWLQAWQRNVGVRENIVPVVVIGRLSGQTLFLLPLALQTSRLMRRLMWLGSDICNYNAPLLCANFASILPPSVFPRLWQRILAVLKDRMSPDIVDLQKMPERLDAQANPFLSLPVVPHASDAYQATLDGTWKDFYEGNRSAPSRKNDRKKRKRMNDFGPVQFVSPTDKLEVEQTIDALLEQKGRSLSALGATNLFEAPGYREFLRDFSQGGIAQGLLHISSLNVGPLKAATNYALTFRKRYYYILAGYDDGEIARFGPGLSQLIDLLRYSLERGFDEFDFTIGDEPYKRVWHNKVTRLFDGVYALSVRGQIIVIPIRISRWLKRSVKRNETLWNVTKKYRAIRSSLSRNNPSR